MTQRSYAELDGLEKHLGATGYLLYAERIAAVRRATEKAAADADPPLVIARKCGKPRTPY